MQTNVKPSALIWIDLEMTGLNPDINRILEIAVIVTDDNLNILAEGPVLAIHQEEKDLLLMDEWNTTHHNESGLISRVVKSNVSEAQAEKKVLDFIKQYVDPKQSPICGNSIYQDRRFLVRYMPELEAFFHYRNIDVSTVKELARRWAPEVYASVKKQGKHLALDDIRESIAELLHYRKYFICS
jgi:oligoribonuclease